jgi:hypothetical protein
MIKLLTHGGELHQQGLSKAKASTYLIFIRKWTFSVRYTGSLVEESTVLNLTGMT